MAFNDLALKLPFFSTLCVVSLLSFSCGDDDDPGESNSGGSNASGGERASGGTKSGAGGGTTGGTGEAPIGGAGGEGEQASGGSSGGTKSGAGGSSTGGTGEDPIGGAGGAAENPLYVLGAELETPEGDIFYMDTVVDLQAPIDLVANGIEIANASRFYAKGQYVYVGLNNAPTITRYVLDENDRLQEDTTLSFSNLGVTSASFHSFISDTKAYLYDSAAHVAHVWNPSTMTLTGIEIDYSTAYKENLSTSLGSSQLRSDGILFHGGGWGQTPGSLLVAFDTTTDTIVNILKDDRCTRLQFSVATENGDLFFFPHTAGLRDNPEIDPCGLVIRNGQTEFDPEHVLDTRIVFDGGIPTGAFDGPGNFAYFPVLHPGWLGLDSDATVSELLDARPEGRGRYRIWKADLLNESANVEMVIDAYSSLKTFTYEIDTEHALFAILTGSSSTGDQDARFYEILQEDSPVEFSLGIESSEVRRRLVDIVRLR